MVTAVVDVLVGGFSSMALALGTLILDVFEQLVWTGTALTPLAIWGLLFGGLGIAFGIVNRFVKA